MGGLCMGEVPGRVGSRTALHPVSQGHPKCLRDFGRKAIRCIAPRPGEIGLTFPGQRNCKWENVLHDGFSEEPTKGTINEIGILHI